MGTQVIRKLTTADNPFDPHDQYDEWNAYDKLLGYHTISYFARICNLSDDLSEADQLSEINRAIDVILEENITGNYKVVERTVKIERLPM